MMWEGDSKTKGMRGKMTALENTHGESPRDKGPLSVTEGYAKQ
jgi:hypothetical protein